MFVLEAEYRGETNLAVVEYVDLDGVGRAVEVLDGQLALVVAQVDAQRLFLRGNDPVFPHAVLLVQLVLVGLLAHAVAGGRGFL